MSRAKRQVLFLCAFNATRSIMAEALLNHLGKGGFRARSAGDYRAREIHPLTLEVLAAHQVPTEGLHSKTWEQYVGLGAPRIDYIISVCDDSLEEPHPSGTFDSLPMKVNWSTANPAYAGGPHEEVRAAFEATYQLLQRRVEALVALPLNKLDKSAQWREISRLGEIT